jgi:hypothetical protein
VIRLIVLCRRLLLDTSSFGRLFRLDFRLSLSPVALVVSVLPSFRFPFLISSSMDSFLRPRIVAGALLRFRTFCLLGLAVSHPFRRIAGSGARARIATILCLVIILCVWHDWSFRRLREGGTKESRQGRRPYGFSSNCYDARMFRW